MNVIQIVNEAQAFKSLVCKMFIIKFYFVCLAKA